MASAAKTSAGRGLATGAAAGCLAATVISVRNPYFVDSLWLGLLVLWACPAVVGAAVWLAVAGLRRVARGRDSQALPARRRNAPRASVLFLLFATVIGSLRLTAHIREMPLPPGDGRPCVLLIGLDGATWDIMDPMMARGEVPNLQALRQEGASGILTSSDPTLSPVVWTTLATGKTRDKHGIRDFTYTQENLKAPRMWELLEAEGKTVGTQSWLVTWPPTVRNGFQIPGWLARDSETYPPELHFAQDLILGEGLDRSPRQYLAYLLDAPWIGVRLTTLAQAFRLVAYSKLKHPPTLDLIHRKYMLKARVYADIFCWLARRYKPDFSAVVFYGTDSLGHVYWKYMEALSSLSKESSGSANASSAEHTAGSAPSRGPGAAGNGAPGAATRGLDRGAAVTAEEAERYGRVIYAYYQLIDSLLPRLLASLPADKTVCILSDHGHGPREEQWGYFSLMPGHLIEVLGLAETVRVASLGDWTFITPAPGLGLEAMEEATRRLSSLTVIGTGEPFLEIEMTGSAGFSLRVTHGTDITDTLLTRGGERLPVADFVDKTDLSGTHTLEGVIILSGRGIKKGWHIESSSLVDIAPTLLYLMKSTVGMDMDGRVLTECLTEGHLAANPIKTVESRDGEVELPKSAPKGEMPEAVRERLRELGYIK